MKNYKKIGNRIWQGPPAEKRFDMNQEPLGQKWYFVWIIWIGTTLRKWIRRVDVKKTNMKGVKPPYILICNHNSFYDFYIMSSLIKPHRGHFPGALDDFIGREWISRRIGIIPTRKFAPDISLIRIGRKVVKNGEMYGLYAEARYSLCGITEVIPDAVSQLVKFLGVPVVTIKMKGHHIYNPYWNMKSHRLLLKSAADMTQLLTAEDIKKMSAQEIHEAIVKNLEHDDWRWQSENRIKLARKNRAEGLDNVLYKCPVCGCETKMSSKGAQLFCGECGKSWTLNYYGELEADKGETEFKFPSDWYRWEREEVKKEVYAGTYRTECDVKVNDLPNSKGFIYMGEGKLVHDAEGFKLHGVREYDGVDFSMEIPALQQYACHVEFKYRFGWNRDCINLNTIDDTWYIFPEDKNIRVAKVALATEEIYNKLTEEKKAKFSKKSTEKSE